MQSVSLREETRGLRRKLVRWRRDFHMHPELGFAETRTAGIVAEWLRRLGYQVQTGVAKTGVVGVLEGRRPGPVMMLRFDMDALPIQEANDVSYASKAAGKMHACGHDGHVAIGLGTAELMARHRERWQGTLKLVFQPAEEGQGGAETMVRERVLESPAVDVIFALHLSTDLPVGQIAVREGVLMAASDQWTLTITGHGGHGAKPHQTVDPIVAASGVVLALQTVVSRSLSPQKPAVVSVGTIHAGEAFNIIPSQLEMTGTIRTLESRTRDAVLQRCRAVVSGVCKAMGAQADLRIVPTCPALVNEHGVTKIMRAAAEAVFGSDSVQSGEQVMGSEDAAFFLQEVPGCYALVGAANEERGLSYPNHHACFDFDEDALPLAVAVLAQACLLYSQSHQTEPRQTRSGEVSPTRRVRAFQDDGEARLSSA